MPSAYSIPALYEKEIRAVVSAGYYSNKSEVVRDALRNLFESKKHLRQAAAVELYKTGEVTLGKAAELAELSFFDFKSVLKDQGVKETMSEKSGTEVRKQVEKIRKARGG